MSDRSNQPKHYDAVLGNQALPPVGGVVLGGIAGIKQRFSHYPVEYKIAMLPQALKYGQAGLEFIIQALEDPSQQVQWTAYAILRERAEPRIKQILENHLPSIELSQIDCTRLGGLLAIGNWHEADRETAAIMLKAAGQEKDGSLGLKDIERLPRKTLWLIDSLWSECSEGRFGLSVQKKIWQSIGGHADASHHIWYDFCDRVQWRVNSVWVQYDRLTFNLDAPKGHLPFLVVGGFWIPVCLQSLFDKLEDI